MANELDILKLKSYVKGKWEGDVIDTLKEYIAVPNVSPSYDEDVLTNGLMEKAMAVLSDWVHAQEVAGLTLEVVQETGRTPLMFIEIAPFNAEEADVGTVLMYGHMDKQPPLDGWDEGLGPYTPVVKDGKLYGRGSADDGYSVFCAVTAIKALQDFNSAHARIVIVIEACEESGSPDLEFYINLLLPRIKTPNFIVCLDSGCGNYDQLWVTSSLRGVISGKLKVEIGTKGVHSGDASGVMPGTFRLCRGLISRVEDEATGEIKIDSLYANMTQEQIDQVKAASDIIGLDQLYARFPIIDGASFVSNDAFQLALNRWWRPQLVVTGAAGLPDVSVAGNVLRPFTTLSLSMRLPPTVNAETAIETLGAELLKDAPYGANVTFTPDQPGQGWAAPALADWLKTSIDAASNEMFSKPPVFYGEGGSIPFMGMLSDLFPRAQFCVTGVLGPGSNAHGPNESLDIDFSGKLTTGVSLMLYDHCKAKVETLPMGNPVAVQTFNSKNIKIMDLAPKKPVVRRKDGLTQQCMKGFMKLKSAVGL